jgi:hypothetical protein
MANKILIESVFDLTGILAQATITLTSLGIGAARQSTLITNSNPEQPSALLYVRIKSGTSAPAAGGTYDIYLLRANGSGPDYITDGGGSSDAAITIENAQLIGSIIVTNTASKFFYGEFDLSHLGPLGPTFGFAVKNNTNQSISSTASDHKVYYDLYAPEVQ